MADGRADPDLELAEARVADAATARRMRRRHGELQAEESTLVGLLGALAGAGRVAVLVGTGGRRTAGLITDVGLEVVEVETAADRTTALRISSLLAVESPGLPATGVGRGAADTLGDRTMAEVVADLVGTGDVVAFTLGDGLQLDGEVLGVGQDVVIVRAGGPEIIYVALVSLNEVAWPSSAG